MERKIGSGLLITPLLYAIIVLLCLFLHFSQFEDFSRQMKNLSYNGTITVKRGVMPSRISRLNILINGLELKFSSRLPLLMITEDGIKRNLILQEMSRDEDSLLLNFKYDTSIRISSDPLSNNSTIEFTVPKTLPPVKELRLHAASLDPFQLSRDDEGRYMLSDGTSTFFLNMDQNFSIGGRGKILSVSMTDRTSSVLALEDEAPGLGRTVREWLAEKDTISEREYNDFIKLYRADAYKGWKTRFNKNLGDWSFPGSESAFSEMALVHQIGEVLNQKEYTLLMGDLLKAGERHKDQLSWFSAPFTGDIVNKGAPLLRGDPEQLLAGAVSLSLEGNPELSPFKEILELESILINGDQMDYDAWIEENLFPLITWLEEGLFLFHPENPVSDSLLNLQAADLLIQAGNRTESSRLIQIGRKLMMSLLAKRDEVGFLPETISFSRERASQGSGFIPPETVLNLFRTPSYSPRIIDISEQTGENIWLYTAAASVQVKSDNTAMDVNINYPKGQIHHIIIKGVKPFDRIQLHGIRWKSDPHFQRYSDGWVYDSVNRALYIKIRQRSEKETVRILYNSPLETTQKTEENSETGRAGGRFPGGGCRF